MPNATLEEVLEEAKALPPEEQQQLAKLLNSFGHPLLAARLLSILEKMQALKPEEQQQARKLLINEQQLLSSGSISEKERRARMARRIRGKYAHIKTSSEMFASLKQGEIKLEDRR